MRSSITMARLVTRFVIVIAPLLASLTGASVATAGAWVVISLDSGVALRAATPSDFGFTVLRHGVTPETWDDGLVVAFTAPDGRVQRFDAVADGSAGHHVATVELAEPGEYRYRITAADGGFLGMTDETTTITVDAADDPADDAPGGAADELDGAWLFEVKGCATCHSTTARTAPIAIGPPLANAAAWAGTRRPGLSAADYLGESIDDPDAFISPMWSTDPAAVSAMPALGLTDAERDAVVEFLLADPSPDVAADDTTSPRG